MKARRVFSLLFAVILVISSFSFVSAADERASAHLSRYRCYIEAIGDGDVEIFFHVYGTGYMASIGSTKIIVQCSTDGGNKWVDVRTFTSDDYPEMLASGVVYYLSSVTHEGFAGRMYRADVTVYASDGTTSTSRTVAIDGVTAY